MEYLSYIDYDWVVWNTGRVTVWTLAGLVSVAALSAIWSQVIRPVFIGFDYTDKHVFITGASTGLGFAYAELVVKRGGSVTIVSRNADRLESARVALLGHSGSVHAVQGDVTVYSDLELAAESAVDVHGPIDVLITCAGSAHPGYFSSLPLPTFSSSLSLNYLGSLYAVRACLPHLAPSPRIVFVSSAVAAISFVGYSAYAPSKFAVRGLAETLRNELAGVTVQQFLPSSIDTPGYEKENQTKPVECSEIEGTAALWSPADTALALHRGIVREDPVITMEAVVEMARVVGSGVMPRRNLCWELLIMPVCVVVAAVCVKVFDATVKQHRDKREEQKKEE